MRFITNPILLFYQYDDELINKICPKRYVL